jgi:hypothetical protein
MHTYDITISTAIVACLLLMVLVEVGSRQLIIGLRYLNVRNQAAAVTQLRLGRVAPETDGR